MTILTKRVSDSVADEDGTRILVDRYWPRGTLRDDSIDVWRHEVAPSPELIAWYGRRRERWDEFKRRYQAELARPGAAEVVEDIRRQAGAGPVTLIYGSRDREYNGARALAEYLGGLEASSPPALAPAAAPVGTARGSRSASHRLPLIVRFGSIMEWSWLIFGLSIPLLLLFGGEALIVFGQRAWVALGSITLAICAGTVARVSVQERKAREALGSTPPLHDRASILVPVSELGLAVAGFVLGFALLVIALVLISLLARAVA